MINIDKEKIGNAFESIKENAKKISSDVSDKAKNAIVVTKDAAVKSKDKVVTALDVNNDGTVDVEDVIILGLRTPGVGINRSEFLKKELMKNYSEEMIQKCIDTTPAKSGIKIEEINKISDEVIKYERNCVSGISAALGAPGGAAMIATLPADVIQYYAYMLRAAQKLMYLYGFPQIDVKEENQTFDSETMNILIICLGVMYGVAGANNAIKAMAKGLSKGIGNKIMTTALTKGTWYPIVKKISKWFGVKMTKKLLVGVVDKSVPLVGALIGGGITYASFKPCCDKLKLSLQDTALSNPNHVETEEEKALYVHED